METQKMKKSLVAAAGLAALSIAPAWGFTFNEVKYWVGTGTNRCAVVIDFNDGSVANCSFAWGYRWNGEAPNMKAVLDEITADDTRLKMFASQGQYGSFINAFAYDVDGDGGTFTLDGYVKSDPDDLFPEPESYTEKDEETGGYVTRGTSWMQLHGTGTAFDDISFTDTPNGVDLTYPEDGEWICWRVCTYATTYDSEWNFVDYYSYTGSEYVPVAAPRAFRMDNIRYWIGSGTNRCAVVVDFNDGSVETCSFAWGYRWNGESPNMTTILRQIEVADPRVKVFASQSQYGTYVNAFAYDADGDGGTFALDGYVKSDPDDLFPEPESYTEKDEETGGYVTRGTSWMQLHGKGASFGEVSFTDTPNGVDLTNPEDGEWICWRLCTYATSYDSEWNFTDYHSYTGSEYLASPAWPSATVQQAMPKVGYSTYASLAAAFDASRGGGSVTLPEQSSVDLSAKTVSVGSAAAETLQTYAVPIYFDMATSGSSVKLILNAAATPTLAAADESEQAPFSVDEDTVTVVPGNVIDGLYYGLAVSTDLKKGFVAPTEWIRAENGKVILQKTKDAAASGEFYKVRVSDVDESAK